MYTCPEGNEKHTTTNNLFNCFCEDGGTLYSLDISIEHAEFARKFCSKGKQGHIIIIGDSVDSLTKLSPLLEDASYKVEVLCLDSKDFDEDHMVNEYNAIKERLAEKHYVLVDDIHNPNSVKYKKMVPELKRLGYECLEINTPTGMLIASKGLPLPEKD
jgi:predicted O-methyltransferase YrrM